MTFDPDVGDGAQFMDVAQLQAALAGYSLVDPATDCEVTPADAGGLAVDVSSGTAHLGGPAESISAQSDVALPASDPDDPRKALVYLDGTGTVQTLGGDPAPAAPPNEEREKAAVPSVPIPASDYLPLASVWIPAGATTISSGDIRSRRIGLDMPSGGSVFGRNTSIPARRAAHVSVGVNGAIYTVAGEDASGTLQDTVYEYVAADDTQTTVASLPASLINHAGGDIDGKVYISGGNNPNNNPQDTLYEYTPSSDSWATKSAMPDARYRHAAAAVGSDLYVAGGNDGSFTSQDTIFEYDSINDTWSTVAPLPEDRVFAAAAGLDGLFYVIGGNNSNGDAQDTIYEYDPGTDTVSTPATLPVVKERHAAAAVDGSIYITGGLEGGSLDDVYEYDPTTDTVEFVSKLPSGRYHHANTTLQDNLYAVAGNSPNFNAQSTLYSRFNALTL